MNIKSRLKKIENRIIKSDSEFCDCPGEIKLILPTIDGTPVIETFRGCDECGKPIERIEPLIFTFNFNSDVKLTGKA